jgi:hypothetical protein
MRAQITLAVNEGKRIIAKAVAAMPLVRRALEGGKIFLKGGSTTSAICEELVGGPLRISGRITPAGLKAPRDYSRVFHNCVNEGGQASDPGEALEELVEKFKPDGEERRRSTGRPRRGRAFISSVSPATSTNRFDTILRENPRRIFEGP